MRQPSRAERRINARRMKQKAKQMIKTWGYENDELDDRHVGRHADNMKICSCWRCANPRKVSGIKTIQERRFDIKLFLGD